MMSVGHNNLGAVAYPFPISYTATRHLDTHSQSVGGFSNQTGGDGAGGMMQVVQGLAYPGLDATASNTAAMTASHKMFGSSEEQQVSNSGSMGPG